MVTPYACRSASNFLYGVFEIPPERQHIKESGKLLLKFVNQIFKHRATYASN